VANPRPSGVVKLEGASDLWRIRVGEWRVVYRISEEFETFPDFEGYRFMSSLVRCRPRWETTSSEFSATGEPAKGRRSRCLATRLRATPFYASNGTSR